MEPRRYKPGDPSMRRFVDDAEMRKQESGPRPHKQRAAEQDRSEKCVILDSS